MTKLYAFLGTVLDLLQGETARVIGYGAAIFVWAVAGMVGAIPNVPFEVALQLAITAIALLVAVVEGIRHFVSSPMTVADLEDEIGDLKTSIGYLQAEAAAVPHPTDPDPGGA